jgi:hypothetical protein
MPERSFAVAIAVAVWLSVAVMGFAIQAKYGATPGEGSDAPGTWPAESMLQPALELPRILVFLHPHCPCSHATLAQLERVLFGAGSAVHCDLIFVAPPGTERGWEDGKLLHRARRLASASIHIDSDGTEARLFGAATSGQVLFYDTNSRLRLSAGITPLRGHAGESSGSVALRALLTGSGEPFETGAVFGCPLFDASTTNPPGPCCTP